MPAPSARKSRRERERDERSTLTALVVSLTNSAPTSLDTLAVVTRAARASTDREIAADDPSPDGLGHACVAVLARFPKGHAEAEALLEGLWSEHRDPSVREAAGDELYQREVLEEVWPIPVEPEELDRYVDARVAKIRLGMDRGFGPYEGVVDAALADLRMVGPRAIAVLPLLHELHGGSAFLRGFDAGEEAGFRAEVALAIRAIGADDRETSEWVEKGRRFASQALADDERSDKALSPRAHVNDRRFDHERALRATAFGYQAPTRQRPRHRGKLPYAKHPPRPPPRAEPHLQVIRAVCASGRVGHLDLSAAVTALRRLTPPAVEAIDALIELGDAARRFEDQRPGDQATLVAMVVRALGWIAPTDARVRRWVDEREVENTRIHDELFRGLGFAGSREANDRLTEHLCGVDGLHEAIVKFRRRRI